MSFLWLFRIKLKKTPEFGSERKLPPLTFPGPDWQGDGNFSFFTVLESLRCISLSSVLWAFSIFINKLLAFLGSNALLISSWVSWPSPLPQCNVWNFQLVPKVLFVVMGLGMFMQQYSHGCSCTNCSSYGTGCLQRQWLCYSPVYLYTSNLHLMCN